MEIKPYYQDEWVTIYHGDCREILPQLPDNSVDLVLTDPPYFLPVKHYMTRSMTAKSWGDLTILEHFFSFVFERLAQVMSNNAFAYVFCDGQSYPVFYKCGYSNFEHIRPIIWDKLTSINGYCWRHQHEIILFANMPNSPNINTGDGDVLRFRAVKLEERLHLAQKPEDLITKLLSKHEGIILDPFLGSGTTCYCAKKLNRKSIGIEIEEKYCEIAAKRCSQGVFNFNAR